MATAAPRPWLLAHYMPWFESKGVSGKWGWHWTMGRVDAPRALAANYHPVIGPYDSGDPAVLEWHLKLMQTAGIDGIVVDWYGLEDYRDYPVNHRHADLAVSTAARLGMRVAVCYEDQTLAHLPAADRAPAARRALDWLGTHWFRLPGYLRISDHPVLLSFGHDGLSDSEWSAVLAAVSTPVTYLSEHRRRPAAAGAFDWPVPREGRARQSRFATESARWPVSFAVAYPRFADYYAQAGVHASWGEIPDQGGGTLTETLSAALASRAAAVQIATWNDWGEGTQIEPSREQGLRDLEIVQHARRARDPAFPYGPADLARLLAARPVPR